MNIYGKYFIDIQAVQKEEETLVIYIPVAPRARIGQITTNAKT